MSIKQTSTFHFSGNDVYLKISFGVNLVVITIINIANRIAINIACLFKCQFKKSLPFQSIKLIFIRNNTHFTEENTYNSIKKVLL